MKYQVKIFGLSEINIDQIDLVLVSDSLDLSQKGLDLFGTARNLSRFRQKLISLCMSKIVRK